MEELIKEMMHECAYDYDFGEHGHKTLNGLVNEIYNKHSEQLRLCGVIKRSELLKGFVEGYVKEFKESGTTGWEQYDKAKKLLETL